MLRHLLSRSRGYYRSYRAGSAVSLFVPAVTAAAALATHVAFSDADSSTGEVCTSGKEIEAGRRGLLASSPTGVSAQQSANVGAGLKEILEQALASASPDRPARSSAETMTLFSALAELLETDNAAALVPMLVSVDQVESFATLLLAQPNLSLSPKGSNSNTPAGQEPLSLAAQVAILRALANFTAVPGLPAERSPMVLAAAASALEHFGPLALSTLASKGSDEQSKRVALDGLRWSLAALSNAVAEEDVGFSHFGAQLLSVLGRICEMPNPLPSKSSAVAMAASPSSPEDSPEAFRRTLITAIKDEAALVLSGCCQMQSFNDIDIATSGVIDVLARAVDAKRDPLRYNDRATRFACAALRELSWQYPEGGAVATALAKSKAVASLMDLVLSPSSNIWTKRAASKALSVMIAKPALLQGAGLRGEEVYTALQAAGKDDFVCGKWQREAERALARLKAKREAAASKREAGK